MKNNKILYLLTILIALFSFNMRVDAAQELTCLYGNGKDDVTIAFVQKKEKNGTKNYKQYILEIDKANASVNDEGWKKLIKSLNDKNYDYGSSYAGNTGVEGEFNSCPGSIKYETSQYIVYNSSAGGDFTVNEDSEGKRTVYYTADLIKYEDMSSGYNEAVISGIPCNQLLPDKKWLQNPDSWEKSKYQMGCVYQFENYNNACKIIQLNVGKEERIFITSDQIVNPNHAVSIGDDHAFSHNMIKELYQGQCPRYIMAATDNGITYIDEAETIDVLTWHKYELINYFGKNIVTDDILTTNELIINPTDTIKSCSDLFVEDETILNLVKTLIKLVNIFIPIILIGFGIIDFGMAIFAGEEDKMKKAQKKFITRTIIAVVIFLVPSALKLILSIANSVWPNIDATLCGLI